MRKGPDMNDGTLTMDKGTRNVLLVLALMMLLSFGFGVSMFLPEEHRTQKLNEMMHKYEQRTLPTASFLESEPDR